jgi:hypothetical protein
VSRVVEARKEDVNKCNVDGEVVLLGFVRLAFDRNAKVALKACGKSSVPRAHDDVATRLIVVVVSNAVAANPGFSATGGDHSGRAQEKNVQDNKSEVLAPGVFVKSQVAGPVLDLMPPEKRSSCWQYRATPSSCSCDTGCGIPTLHILLQL